MRRSGTHTAGMAQAPRMPQSPPESPVAVAADPSEESQEPTASPDELLALLGDEYTYRVFGAVVERARTGREIIETADVSKATVYRRLDRLEEAGLVETSMHVDTDGHHCKRFHAVVESIRIGFTDDGFTASIETDRPARSTRSNSAGQYSIADD